MGLNEPLTYYEVLNLKPDASPQEIREAYLRTKATFNKDNIALYTLVGPEEREESVREIEKAYEVLSSPERRREYDSNHGVIQADDDFSIHHQPTVNHRKVISIDRVPPMESTGEDILMAPKTDSVSPPPHPHAHPPPVEAPKMTTDPTSEIEWKGTLLKKVREELRISIEEMAGHTKISKTYIRALEAEDFSKLPAAVFVRGFVTQISKMLKLPHDRVASAFMARYNLARPEKK